MAGRWTDDNQGEWRAREDEPFDYGRDREPRSWERERPDLYAARRSGPDRDRVFGERESGDSYGSRAPSTGYQGRPATQKVAPRFGAEDYTQGGRFYGDDSRERVYREEYGQGGVTNGAEPRGYDAGGYSPTRARYHANGFGDPGFDHAYPQPSRRRASGGTGGYDYELGYGDGGRDTGRHDRAERFEEAGRGAGEFLHRAGEKVAAWFGGGGEGRAYADSYDEADHRGRGPQGYKRSDERINEDAHERLTEDRRLDASGIVIAVSAGEVTLSGTVNNRDDKHRAERIVEGVSGVHHVQNNLRAASADGYAPRGDSVLGEQIIEAGTPSKDEPALRTPIGPKN